MKRIHSIIIVLLLILFSCKNTTKVVEKSDLSFEEYLLNLNLVKRDSVTEKDFEKAKYIYGQTINKIKQDSLNFTSSDYWNLTYCLIAFNEPTESIRKAFFKSYKLSPDDTGYILQHQQKNSSNNFDKLAKIIPEVIDIANNYQEPLEEEINISDYSIKNNVSFQLVKTLSEVEKNDQKYRDGLGKYKKNLERQTSLDKRNQIIIDSLYNKYETYIGKTLVGNEFKSTMWLVVQHSNIKMMKNYLPIIHQAVKDKEIPKGPLKMLIDRIYSIEYGYQIFGSQGKVDLANEEIRNEVINKYDMDNL